MDAGNNQMKSATSACGEPHHIAVNAFLGGRSPDQKSDSDSPVLRAGQVKPK
jgi:hypothetical protein